MRHPYRHFQPPGQDLQPSQTNSMSSPSQLQGEEDFSSTRAKILQALLCDGLLAKPACTVCGRGHQQSLGWWRGLARLLGKLPAAPCIAAEAAAWHQQLCVVCCVACPVTAMLPQGKIQQVRGESSACSTWHWMVGLLLMQASCPAEAAAITWFSNGR
jgi:hypothetical protein